MEKVFASVRFSLEISVAVARTSQRPFPLSAILSKSCMKSRFLTFLFIFLIFFSCKQKQLEKIPETNNPIQNTKVEYGKNFFDFDEVDYYSNQITEDDAMKLLDNQTSKIEKQKYNVCLLYTSRCV